MTSSAAPLAFGLSILTFAAATSAAEPASDRVFRSPYDDIDWSASQQYKFDGHVHARRGSSVEQVVAAYADMGYGAIAFGDGTLQYPLDDYLDDPDAYDITVIPGQGNLHSRDEAPWANHTKVWFAETNYNHRESAFEQTLERVGHDDGLIIFAHPASHIYPMYGVNVAADWYIDHLDRHEHILGIEVNNHDPEGSLRLFDDLLKHYGERRRVVGVGVSDTQGLRDDGSIGSAGGNFGLSVVIADNRDRDTLRDALEAGRLFWVATTEPDARTQRIPYPRITAIEVADDAVTVRTADDNATVAWIYDNEVIAEGQTFTRADLAEPDQNYVRFEVRGDDNGVLGSQAFYLVRDPDAEAD